MRPRIQPSPNFEAFRDTLLLRRAAVRPPLFDFHIAPPHKEAMLGRPSVTAQDEVEFFRLAGYDFVQATVTVVPEELAEEHGHVGSATAGYHGVVHSLDQYRSRRWSWEDAAEGDLQVCTTHFDWVERLASAMPDSMRIMLHGADVFTLAWMLMGFEPFCMASLDEPELIDAVMGSLADAQINVLAEAIRRVGDRIGGILYSDDIAYSEGLMLRPEFFRRHLFEIISRVAKLGQSVGAPLIYHSDGKLYDVFDDIAALGAKGIQPLEPKSMDPLEIKERWPGKFCLIGNIDLDLMSRGTPDEVECQVRTKIERLNVGGGYIVGVSNTVPDYVSYPNYVRMIETVYSYEAE